MSQASSRELAVGSRWERRRGSVFAPDFIPTSLLTLIFFPSLTSPAPLFSLLSYCKQ
ncbi:hypothetical protein GQ53DRAFT_750434 [Thozetella sp. PMI_491]|nr:hypothetical protein GQ53DRAFT_750434 [Thozetella sp. PMI_491]